MSDSGNPSRMFLPEWMKDDPWRKLPLDMDKVTQEWAAVPPNPVSMPFLEPQPDNWVMPAAQECTPPFRPHIPLFQRHRNAPIADSAPDNCDPAIFQDLVGKSARYLQQLSLNETPPQNEHSENSPSGSAIVVGNSPAANEDNASVPVQYNGIPASGFSLIGNMASSRRPMTNPPGVANRVASPMIEDSVTGRSFVNSSTFGELRAVDYNNGQSKYPTANGVAVRFPMVSSNVPAPDSNNNIQGASAGYGMMSYARAVQQGITPPASSPSSLYCHPPSDMSIPRPSRPRRPIFGVYTTNTIHNPGRGYCISHHPGNNEVDVGLNQVAANGGWQAVDTNGWHTAADAQQEEWNVTTRGPSRLLTPSEVKLWHIMENNKFQNGSPSLSFGRPLTKCSSGSYLVPPRYGGPVPSPFNYSRGLRQEASLPYNELHDTRNTPHLYCSLCKSNGESFVVYSSHDLKTTDGKVLCPILRSYVCNTCSATGDNAHTRMHCPVVIANGERVTPVAVQMKLTKRRSDGRERKATQLDSLLAPTSQHE